MDTHTYHQEAVNLHTHSFYCGHGIGTIEDYWKEAENKNLGLLGFSEHCPVPDGRWQRSRMLFDQMTQYEQDVQKAKALSPASLTILTGYECDYLPEYQGYYGEVKEHVDYLICAIHDLSFDLDAEYSVFWNRLTKEDLFSYTDLYCKALESKLFLFGAHPDVFAYNYHRWDAEAEATSRAILDCAHSMDVALEINANGMRKRKVITDEGERYSYPIKEFWELASQYDVKIVTNSDAHAPSELTDRSAAAKLFASSCNISFASFVLSDTGKPVIL
ncbi:MAG: histidinol-phosphatase [Sphaerochaeta sp.]|jgi:histidinol-phosphatase (PHP family)|uniref:histidinol-phosphatase n=1 Tax=Sphaerochaeta sp. TaxID=1972642 RepID=UPI002FC5FBCC